MDNNKLPPSLIVKIELFVFLAIFARYTHVKLEDPDFLVYLEGPRAVN